MKSKITTSPRLAVLAALFISGCTTGGGGTAAANPTDAQMDACRSAAESYWQAPSGSSYVNTTTQNAAGGFDVQLTTSDEYRTTCSISSTGQVSTRPGW